MDERADQNAATRTVAPAEPDADRTRSSGDGLTHEAAGNEPSSTATPVDATSCNRGTGQPRLPAPLQYRDPDRYEVIAEHGRGGLGRVLRARDRELGRSVAIKELLERTKTSELRFFREALITARLEHPGIVPVHEAGRWPDGTPFYAMKLVAGRPLKDVIDDATTLEQRLALIPHVIAVADAVAYAHSKGIIHRDLKPANVIVGEFGETVVIDWGLARESDNADRDVPSPMTRDGVRINDVTVEGTILGTPAYMAPEQRKGEASARTDIYAIGAILYTLISQRPPPIGTDSHGHTASLALNGPRDLVAIVSRAMHADSRRRYESAAGIAADLRNFLNRRPVTARSYGPMDRVILASSRNRTLTATVLLFLSSLFALTLFAALRARQQQRETAAAESAAQIARERAEAKVGELTLANARLLLSTDPTRALSTLATYSGNAPAEASFLRAEASGRGAATKVLALHGDTVSLLAFTSHGQLISSGGNSRIALTSLTSWESTFVTREITPAAHPSHSQQGDRVAFVRPPSTLVVKNVEDGIEHDTALSDTPRRIVLSADGSAVAFYTSDGTVATWNPGKNQTVHIGKLEGITVLALAGDSLLIAASKRRVDVFHGDRLYKSITFDAPATASHISTTDGRFAAGFADGTVKVWSLDDLKLHWSERVCVQPVEAVVVSGGLGYACRDRTAGARDPHYAGNTIVQLESPVRALAMDPTGLHFIAGTENGTVHVAHLSSGFQRTLRGHSSPITKLSTGTTPTGALLLASADAKGEIRVWNLPEPPARVLAHVEDSPYGLKFSRSGDYLVSGSRSGTVRTWHFPSGRSQTLSGHQAFVYPTAVSPDESLAISADFDGKLVAWSLASGTMVASVQANRAAILDIAFLPDGKTIVATGHDGRLVAWQPMSGNIETLYRADQPLRGVEVLNTGHDIVVSHVDGSLVVVTPGKAAVPVRNSVGLATTMLLRAPRSRHVALGNARGEVRFFSPSTGEIRLIARMPDGIRHLAFSTDEKHLAIASEGSSLAILALEPNPVFQLSLENAPTRYLSFGEDGKVLASLSNDGMVRLYDLTTQTWTMNALHLGYINGGAFSPAMDRYVSAGADGRVVALDVTAVLTALKPTN